MQVIKNCILFIQHNFIQLQRKWISLPLLLLFPIAIIALIFSIAITSFSPKAAEPMNVGLVDLDQSEETQMVMKLIEESSQFGDYMRLSVLTETEAENEIRSGTLTAYIIFPPDFTADLYSGRSVQLPIVGNRDEPVKSFLIKELLDSVARHIRASQANILTIGLYAKEIGLDSETRSDLLFEQFKEFLFYTIGKDNVIKQEEIANIATASPTDYFGLASWFLTLTIWLLLIYNFLYRDDAIRMKMRMKLYGVTELQQIIARIIVTLSITFLGASLLFHGLSLILKLDLYFDDYARIFTIAFLYSVLFLIILAIIETLIPAKKLRLLMQSLFTGIAILLSGAVIPTIYFPLYVQKYLGYLFSAEAFRWLQEIILKDRLYADMIPLSIMTGAAFFILLASSAWKERVLK